MFLSQTRKKRIPQSSYTRMNAGTAAAALPIARTRPSPLTGRSSSGLTGKTRPRGRSSGIASNQADRWNKRYLSLSHGIAMRPPASDKANKSTCLLIRRQVAKGLNAFPEIHIGCHFDLPGSEVVGCSHNGRESIFRGGNLGNGRIRRRPKIVSILQVTTSSRVTTHTARRTIRMKATRCLSLSRKSFIRYPSVLLLQNGCNSQI
jgi:hypothetical protein